jgi:uncharacterized protein
MFLADINLWLALAFRSHIHHESGKNWFEGLPNDSCAFCRLTQQGFLRLATNPKAFGAEAVSMSDAWRMFDEFLGDPRVSFADEPANIEPLWRGYTQRRTFSPKVWSDAYLAAFALAAGLELVSFDKGFAQFQSLHCTILS